MRFMRILETIRAKWKKKIGQNDRPKILDPVRLLIWQMTTLKTEQLTLIVIDINTRRQTKKKSFYYLQLDTGSFYVSKIPISGYN